MARTAAAALSGLLALCGATESAVARPCVLATFAPVYSLAANVAGTAAAVEMLLPPDRSPHEFQLRPSDLARIAAADLVLSIGGGVEDSFAAALDHGLRPGATRLVVSAGFDDQNPHVWLDPLLAAKMVERIRDALAGIDPAQAGVYRANAGAMIARLHRLDADLRAQFAPLATKQLVTYHKAFDHFARRYGFEIVGFVECCPEHGPTPKGLAQLRQQMRERRLEVLFTEPGVPADRVAALARDLGVRVAMLDPLDVGPAAADFYERGMRANAASLVAALGAPAAADRR